MDYNSGGWDSSARRLPDFGADRLAGMDATGITVAILSHTVPGVQGIVDPATAASAARDINDRLAGEIARRPDRYAGFASIAVQDPAAAAIELERAVTRLGSRAR